MAPWLGLSVSSSHGKIQAWNLSENICIVSISIIIFFKIAKKILFTVFMSKIINSFPYVVTQLISTLWTQKHE